MSQLSAASGWITACSSFLTSELNIIWKSRSELASIPIRGSRFAGGWSRATVSTPVSLADVRPAQPGKHAARTIRNNAHLDIDELYRHGTWWNFDDGSAEFFDLAGDA